MDNNQISKYFEEFLKNYRMDEIQDIWDQKSKQFHDFWNKCILAEDRPVTESEIDEIIKILDIKAKGNKKGDQAVANVMIPQGVWRRMFNEIKQTKRLQEVLTKIFHCEDESIINLVDELYKINERQKNSLTGKSANAINAMLFAFNPDKYIAVVSLNDRKKIIDYFNFDGGPNFDNDSPGKKIVLSNRAIIDGFKNLGVYASPRAISVFLYNRSLKLYWKPKEDDESADFETESSPLEAKQEISDKSVFTKEDELENFLIKNWEKTELGKDYELIEEDGEMVSQQYRTSIGQVDILVRDKKTKQYVVIELKKGQSSDNAIGQLARYMGWIDLNKPSDKPVKGIIIASSYDENVFYALKKIKDAIAYCYEINFELKEFKK